MVSFSNVRTIFNFEIGYQIYRSNIVSISFVPIEPDNKNDSHATVVAFSISIQKVLLLQYRANSGKVNQILTQYN